MGIYKKKKKVIYKAHSEPTWAALGAERQVCYSGNTIVNHNGHSRTTTSRSGILCQQQVQTKSRFTATAGTRSCELRHANTVSL
jgi:hypothetical protein